MWQTVVFKLNVATQTSDVSCPSGKQWCRRTSTSRPALIHSDSQADFKTNVPSFQPSASLQTAPMLCCTVSSSEMTCVTPELQPKWVNSIKNVCFCICDFRNNIRDVDDARKIFSPKHRGSILIEGQWKRQSESDKCLHPRDMSCHIHCVANKGNAQFDKLITLAIPLVKVP